MRIAIINITSGGISGGYRKYLSELIPRLDSHTSVEMSYRIIRNLFLSLFGHLKQPSAGVHILNSHYVHPRINNGNEKLFF